MNSSNTTVALCYTLEQCYNKFANLNSIRISYYAVSTLAILLNIASIVVFSLGKFNTKFDKYLKIYSINQVIINSHIIVNFVLTYYTPGLQLNSKWNLGFWIFTIRVGFYYISMILNDLVDNLMLSEHLTLYSKNWKLCARTSASQLVVIVCLCSIPFAVFEVVQIRGIIKISNLALLNRFNFANNTKEFYSKLDSFQAPNLVTSEGFKVLENVYFILKFLLFMGVDLYMNILLVFSIKKFYKRIKCMNIRDSSNRKKIKRSNIKIVLVMCLLANILRLMTILSRLCYRYLYSSSNGKSLRVLDEIVGLLISTKSTINFFIFYFLSKKFKEFVNLQLVFLKGALRNVKRSNKIYVN